MAESRTPAAISYKPIRAPRGLALSCKGWRQEAALRLLMNSLDPEIAERPEELMISGGIGKLARDWAAFHAIANSLQTLEDDETLAIYSGAIYSGEPGPILKTHPDAPRVLVVNSPFSPPSQDPRSISREREADREAGHKAGRAMPARGTRMAADWMFTGPSSSLPEAHEIFRAAARKDFGGSLAGRLVVASGMGGMGGAQALAATLNGAAFLGIEIDPARIKRRVKAGYCEVMVNHLDEALRILKNSVRKREPASVALIGNAAEVIPELARRGVLPDLLTDQTPAHDPFAYIPAGLTMAQAAELRERDPHAYREKALDSMAAQVRGMLELKKMGAAVFEFGNGIRAQALARGVSDAREIPGFVSEYFPPDFAQGCGLLTAVALSGDPGDLTRLDRLFSELFADSEPREWMAIARKRPSPGLPARSCWMRAEEAIKLAMAINDLVARGEIKAPVAMGRSIRRNRGGSLLSSQPPAQAVNSGAAPRALADGQALEGALERALAALLLAARGASWLSLQAAVAPDENPDKNLEPSSSFVVVADGKPKMAERLERLFANDFAAMISLFTPAIEDPHSL